MNKTNQATLKMGGMRMYRCIECILITYICLLKLDGSELKGPARSGSKTGPVSWISQENLELAEKPANGMCGKLGPRPCLMLTLTGLFILTDRPIPVIA